MKPNRLTQVFEKKQNLLNIYFTAGFPQLNHTRRIIKALAQAGTDLIEIGMPFSDPLADGPTIQQSSQQAIDNGMTLATLFDQLQGLRNEVDTPILLMGYMNPVLQFGVDKFCQKAAEVGIDGLILPDLPMQEYLDEYRELFARYGLFNIFLITPQTSAQRIGQIDEVSEGFIYMVSSASTTGAKGGLSHEQLAYFERIANMQLRSPRLIGFGISDHQSFATACRYAQGAIIGSAFIKLIAQSQALETDIAQFVRSIKAQ